MATTAKQTEGLGKANRQLITDFLAAFGTGDVDKILSFMSDDSTYWVGGTIEGVSGTKSREEFGAMLSGFQENTKEGAITLTPEAYTVDGDRVAVETESYGALKNGRVYNNHYHFLFVCRDGKITEVKEYLDTEHVTEIFFD
jgi:ketosteroid isomerase-like protein